MITYIAAISKFYPSYNVSSISDEYADIVWGNNSPISKAELDAKILDMQKELKILELSDSCSNAILEGFTSDALGSEYWYDAEEVDQINLLGAVSATAPIPGMPDGFSIYYACRNVDTSEKTYMEHSHLQLRKVLTDGSMFKLGMLQQFHIKRVAVQNCTSAEQVEAVSW